jgi:HlyD family secretion protein
LKLSLNEIKGYAVSHKKASLAILLILGAILIFTFMPKSKKTQSTVAEATVIKGNIEVSVTGTGTVEPVSSMLNVTDTNGTVKSVFKKNGEKVKKGDLIAELTNDTLMTELEKSRLDLERAEVNLNEALDGLASDTTIAPFDGRILSLQVKTGDQISQNMALATIQDDSQLVFDMPVSNGIAQKAVLNQEIEVFLPETGETVQGKIISKNNGAETGSNRTYLKVGILKTGKLSSGAQAFGTLNIDGQKVDALAISSLEWKNETQLKGTLSGKITNIYIEQGQTVKKGQKLFGLKSDSNQNQHKTAQIAYEQAKISLADLEKQVNNLKVDAPMDGTLAGITAKVGDEVATKTSNSSSSSSNELKSLGKVINSGQMEVTLPVDEVDIAKVTIGQKANISVDAFSDKEFTGHVVEIADEGTVANNVSSFDVKVLIDNKDSLLKSSMTANVTIVVADKNDTLLIPVDALQERGKGKFVLIPSSKDQRGSKPVKVGLMNDNYAEILNGLKEGDKILLPNQSTSSTKQSNMMPGMGGPPPNMGGQRRTRSSTGK